MKTITLTLAATALAMTGFAYAGEAKGPTVMSEAQMDAVVAGVADWDELDAPAGSASVDVGDSLQNGSNDIRTDVGFAASSNRSAQICDTGTSPDVCP